MLTGLEPQRELERELERELARELAQELVLELAHIEEVPGGSQVATGHDILRGRLVQVQVLQ